MALINEQYWKETTEPKLHIIFDRTIKGMITTVQQGMNEAVNCVMKDADNLTNIPVIDMTGLDSAGFEKIRELMIELMQKTFETWKAKFIHGDA